ncbi:MAG: hypothetical protein IKA86_01695 [Paraprevotella sp.]|nr:hypothetical protein [Paraprevotella sp.]MBR2379699.1 hypothetical protein [Paraprevotella sp.]
MALINETPQVKTDALTEIRLRKANIRSQINESHQQIKATFDSLFKPAPKPTTRTGRLIGLFDQGFAIFEGVSIGLKIIRSLRHLFGKRR